MRSHYPATLAFLVCITLASPNPTFAQFSQQGPKLVGAGALEVARQGSAVAVSADGNTAIVGGPDTDHHSGAAWIWTKSAGGGWTQQGPRLSGSGGGYLCQQGSSVALSADGNTAIIGGPGDGAFGAVWIWTRQGEVWTQQGNKLVAPGTVNGSQQGTSVSLSADGDTALVGGNGAVWVWTRRGGIWTQQSRSLTAPDTSAGSAYQGRSVCLSADGNTAIVGTFDYYNGTGGGAWIWTRSGGVWTLQSNKLVGSGTASSSGDAGQGFSVALSADGNTAMVGGIGDSNDNYRGAAWVWTRNAGVWTQQGPKLVGERGTEQGYSVALSADGNTAIVAAMGSDLVWTRSGQIWTQVGDLAGAQAVGPSGFVASQETSVALSADGNTAIVGSPLDNVVGAAWVWERNGGSWTQQPKLVGSDIAYAEQGTSVAVSADGNTAVVGGPIDSGGIGAAWVWTRSGGVWTQQSKLAGSGTVGTFVLQGASVAISADGNTVIVGGPRDNGWVGAAWVFTRNAGVWTQQGAKLVGSGVDGIGAEQGVSVSLSADGNTAIVGGYTDGWYGSSVEEPAFGTGAAWVWTRGGDAWTQQGSKLVSSDSKPNHDLHGIGQGYSVALSADGNTAIVGAPYDNAASVWKRTRGGWNQQEPKLAGSGGYSVSLSADGNTAIVGAPYDTTASVWTRNGELWTQQGPRLAGSGSAAGNTGLGTVVSLSADGNTAVVGEPNENGDAPYPYVDGDAGAAWIWTRSEGVWTMKLTLVGTGAAAYAHQGSSVAISFDGSTVIEGAYSDEGGIGAAWVFTATPVSISPQRLRAVRQ
ncbi:MAG TPA: WD40 repeat domain-containing protein [Thermoanaerobaculia bacterium]|jgi:hypothetical protein|nr:WD40 repeat domain-containing protein [Thermoanaerobaculia bacterium]